MGVRRYPGQLAQIVVAETDHSPCPVTSINFSWSDGIPSQSSTLVKRRRNHEFRKSAASASDDNAQNQSFSEAAVRNQAR